MILFDGYMGTILHTGDFRYSPKMLEEMPHLYPGNKRNSNNEGVSIHVDELILDDTYCDPIFNFPKRV
jgi:DNA cross-link repair 1B protein